MKQSKRIAGLRRFAIAITFLNLLGHTVLGFEQSFAQPLIAIITAYSLELLLETIDAYIKKQKPRFVGSITKFTDFLLPAHITGLAVAMLLYANDRLFPVAFAVAVAIGSKAIFRFPDGKRHFFNPSNFGITITLLLFPWIGIAPPYQFTENLSGWADWILPALIVCTGTFLNARFTGKLPLISAWLVGFFLQAIIRSWIWGTPMIAGLIPMTGVAFVLFTFYMVSDPGTTPFKPKEQIFFGLSIAAVYGLLMIFHIVFGLFFALTIVCTIRGLSFYVKHWLRNSTQIKVFVPTTMTITEG